MRKFSSTLIAILAVASPAMADDDNRNSNASKVVSTVTTFGAKCDGSSDDTAAFQRAIAGTPLGGIVTVPKGRCVISQPLVMNRFTGVSFVGEGSGSQIFQKSNATLFDYQATADVATASNPIPPSPGGVGVGVSALIIKDLSLGSAATSPGTALIKLTNASHMRIENVAMMGSYYGLYFNGSLLNTVANLVGGKGGEQSFFASSRTSKNQVWVYGDRINLISANTNTFINPSISGGVDGFKIVDDHGEGSIYIFGGNIGDLSGTGIILQKTAIPSTIAGTRFSSNRASDVTVDQAQNVRISDVRSDKLINLLGDARNISVNDTKAQRIVLDLGNKRFPRVDATPNPGVKRIFLQNISTCLSGGGSAGISPAPIIKTSDPTGFANPLVTNELAPPKLRVDIMYYNIKSVCDDD